jgi:DNA repair photolyase
MRWDGQRVDTSDGSCSGPATLFGSDVVVRTFDTPRFRGITFYEVRARTVLNEVPKPSRVPFRWTINPYRGCSHACVYCFARNTHTYLEFDSGADFDTQIVVKVNAAERLRHELAAPTWGGEHVAMGTNVDCYQRAEGRYRLMPGILAALRDAENPFSILTKGALVLRDLDLLRQARAVTDVSVSLSIGLLDREIWRSVEPGTPSPARRLQVVRELSDAGLRCGVLMAPILPFLTDSPEQLDAAVAAIAAAGAESVTPLVLHLRPGAREWYQAWLRRHHPGLLEDYRALYGKGSYAQRSYQTAIREYVEERAERHGLRGMESGAARRVVDPPPVAEPPASQQLTLL